MPVPTVFDPSTLNAVTVAMLIAGMAVTGLVSGTLAGLLGVGGGIVIVPVLFWVLGLLQIAPEHASHLAVATSLATIIPTSISSMRAHNKRGTVDKDLLKLWGPAVFVGALIGGGMAMIVSGAGLRFLFGVVGLAVAVNMAIPKTLVIAAHLPQSGLVNRVIGAIIGLISSLMGIGGGTLSVPTLNAFSFPPHRAVGTASALGLVIAVPGVIGFIYAGWGIEDLPPGSFGYVSLPAALIIAPVSFFAAPLGARLAHALDARTLKRAFALFLAITSLRMLLG
ncbi:sulfite exporter TauE/SafE family protein [Pseudohoeflea coraliihabitans]|uniref:Probable membrane transporter protein n=1 Tax=Pseudohoeflea coraliihabitans TaxID=2860393 RepID=A0ABS6WR81_9HYPH|nr:sulfite exporter TauE/SafE family protein [Pseudohoeflea sp. DP4N28-3]MBW3098285.1 sulfite exporter TauE/SafE family protein [Pseudohoeflea sp. DP4N28-3]